MSTNPPDAPLPGVTLPTGPFTDACPLHLAMERIARAAVRQHVLYAEGESQPRPTLLLDLERWTALHTLIRTRICVASRSDVFSPEELEQALATLAPAPVDAELQPHRQLLREMLSACAQAQCCPLSPTSVD
jgi:hypothetical protein